MTKPISDWTVRELQQRMHEVLTECVEYRKRSQAGWDSETYAKSYQAFTSLYALSVNLDHVIDTLRFVDNGVDYTDMWIGMGEHKEEAPSQSH